MSRTGVGPSSSIRFTDCDKKIISMCGINALDGHQDIKEPGMPIEIVQCHIPPVDDTENSIEQPLSSIEFVDTDNAAELLTIEEIPYTPNGSFIEIGTTEEN